MFSFVINCKGRIESLTQYIPIISIHLYIALLIDTKSANKISSLIDFIIPLASSLDIRFLTIVFIFFNVKKLILGKYFSVSKTI